MPFKAVLPQYDLADMSLSSKNSTTVQKTGLVDRQLFHKSHNTKHRSLTYCDESVADLQGNSTHLPKVSLCFKVPVIVISVLNYDIGVALEVVM